MAYDEGLAERLRIELENRAGVTEKKMFGGLVFLIDGKMLVGIVKDVLMVRVGPQHYEAALQRPHARPMDFTRKPLKGFVYVDPEGFDADEDLEAWVTRALDFQREDASAQKSRAKKRTRA